MLSDRGETNNPQRQTENPHKAAHGMTKFQRPDSSTDAGFFNVKAVSFIIYRVALETRVKQKNKRCNRPGPLAHRLQ